ncbi:MAG: bifunctional phosphopantothenoylcysteine decarboxylase/phosphopantothenate--cysteine ligase CoaBC [Actinomycetota bacterium]|nr:bifunctional phosphopantothenoylcysteine decarboxylase/phosphopantothenate--cysteine ligase CoaBC [Actinomycetota bacterium]
MLAGRRVVLGVTGGVAAYKAAYLARRLIERGAVVRTVMTQSAAKFVGPHTLAAITGTQPVIDLFDAEDVSPHTTLGRWADAVVVAPATAATLARLANGLSDDSVSATVLATTSPVVIAPAMHTEMWLHPATVANVQRLESFGYHIVSPEAGALAGGDTGLGRLADPDRIADAVAGVLPGGPLTGVDVLITAGGTREPIDRVRYLGNHSSGKMGNAIAAAAARRGANVTLVTAGPGIEHPRVNVLSVDTAAEMADAAWAIAKEADVAVMAAAVADFRPAEAIDGKLRRTDGPPSIDLEPTPDVLGGIAEMSPRPFLVGFAAETGGLDEAIAKARRKGVDLLVANDVTAPGSGFGTETNQVTIVLPDGSTDPWSLMNKSEVAERLWDRIAELRKSKGTAT